jgi:hypothetical protein
LIDINLNYKSKNKINESKIIMADTTPENTINPPDDIPFKDPESAEMELRISKDIAKMPEEVKDRFKALKVLTD